MGRPKTDKEPQPGENLQQGENSNPGGTAPAVGTAPGEGTAGTPLIPETTNQQQPAIPETVVNGLLAGDIIQPDPPQERSAAFVNEQQQPQTILPGADKNVTDRPRNINAPVIGGNNIISALSQIGVASTEELQHAKQEIDNELNKRQTPNPPTGGTKVDPTPETLLKTYGEGYVEAKKGDETQYFTRTAWDKLSGSRSGWEQIVKTPPEVQGLIK